MNIEINELPIYVISGAKAVKPEGVGVRERPCDLDHARREVYINEFKRIGVLDNVTEVPAIFDGHPNCGQYGSTKAHANAWADIVINNHKHALVNEDDVMFHDNFTTLFPEYCKRIPADGPRKPKFLYANVGGKFRRKKDRAELNYTEPVHNYTFWNCHSYLLSYEGAMSMLQHYYNIEQLPIFDRLPGKELKVDVQWMRWWERLSMESRDRVYSFGSTPDIPAQWNGFKWHDDETRHVPSFCPGNGLAYQTEIKHEDYINKLDFHLRKTTTY
jgi:hypothetical protein